MCEYMRLRGQSQTPFCIYTMEFCTFCVLGNKTTYNEAKAKSKEKEGEEK